MEQGILTERQQKIIKLVAGEKNLASFYLTGGTALAGYYLYHRLSDDLDFFTFEDPDRIFIHTFAKRILEELGAERMRFERLYDRNQFFFQFGEDAFKVEFTQYPFLQLEAPLIKDHLKVDGLRDIAANKLAALLDRFEPKDFVDLFFIMQERKLVDIRRDAEAKFKMQVGALFLGGELMKVRRIEALPKMIKQLSVEELKTFFADRAKELAPEILR